MIRLPYPRFLVGKMPRFHSIEVENTTFSVGPIGNWVRCLHIGGWYPWPYWVGDIVRIRIQETGQRFSIGAFLHNAKVIERLHCSQPSTWDRDNTHIESHQNLETMILEGTKILYSGEATYVLTYPRSEVEYPLVTFEALSEKWVFYSLLMFGGTAIGIFLKTVFDILVRLIP